MVRERELHEDLTDRDRRRRRRGDDWDSDAVWWSDDGEEPEERDERRRDKSKNAWKRQRHREDDWAM